MIRETSIETYRQIKEEGLLSRLRFQVYDIIYQANEPISQGEVCELFGIRHKQSLTPRFAELERMGVIRTAGIRPCRITNKNVLVWITTDRLPEKLEKPTRHKCTVCDGKGFVAFQNNDKSGQRSFWNQMSQ